jgi:hypothetical protein
MTEVEYRDALSRGRIRAEDIDAVLAREADAEIVPGLQRRNLWRAMLTPGVRAFDAAGTAWRMEEGDLAEDFRSPGLLALFDACLARTEPAPSMRPPGQPRRR